MYNLYIKFSLLGGKKKKQEETTPFSFDRDIVWGSKIIIEKKRTPTKE